MTDKKQNGNGHGKYKPEVVYRHFDVDVWGKKVTGEDKETIAYGSDLEAELDALDSEEFDTDEEE